MARPVLASALALAMNAAVLADALVDFDRGPEGWSLNGFDTVTPAGGNPGACIDFFVFETFGINVSTTTNEAFIGDYSVKGPATLAIDFDVDSISFFGTEVRRGFVVELRDYDNPPAGYPWVSVWLSAGLLPTPAEGWATMTFEVLDPTSLELPGAWRGYGAEDPKTFEPKLPDDRTYASVVSSVDEVVFTTFVPGFASGFTQFDLRIDNISITLAPDCPEDLDGNTDVGFDDLVMLLSAWGNDGPGAALAAPADEVTFDDLVVLLAAWGPC